MHLQNHETNYRHTMLKEIPTQAAQDIALARTHNSPLMVLDCQQVLQQYRLLSAALPRAELYYAIKACDHPKLLHFMHQHTTLGFDIASSGEIQQLRNAQVYSQRTIHTHPIKTDYEIRSAIRYGCTTFVVDNPDELDKLAAYAKRIAILLRLNCASKEAAVPLAKKFGLAPTDIIPMLQRAKTLGLHVKGLSFHVGSQTPNPQAHVAAIEVSRDIFQQARAHNMLLRVLDIGGGFPVNYTNHSAIDIKTFCQPIKKALANWPQHTEIIAEPGRFLVASAGRSICQVIGKAKRNGVYWYYLNDGVYGSFSGQIYDGMHYPLSLPEYGPPENWRETFPSVIAGPSCDSVDIIHHDIALPELALGDLVTHRQMGAYSIVSASRFNRLPAAKIITL